MQIIFSGLSVNSTLRSLNISFNKIGSKGAECIASYLQSNTSLEVLTLWKNYIGDAGAHYIANALKTNSTLQSLDISSCQITNRGLESFLPALQRNRSLMALGVDDNDIAKRSIYITIYRLLKRNMEMRNICKNSDLMSKTADFAIATQSGRIPLYILLEIVEWNAAIEFSQIELTFAKQCHFATSDHLKYVQSLYREERAEMIDYIFKKCQ